MMLVLSRKIGETIQISDDIRVTVKQVSGGRVRLAIEAPESIRIRREEIADVPSDLQSILLAPPIGCLPLKDADGN
jgi:carbon storage regulator